MNNMTCLFEKENILTKNTTKEKEVIFEGIENNEKQNKINELVQQFGLSKATIINILEHKPQDIPEFYGIIELLKYFNLLEYFTKNIKY